VLGSALGGNKGAGTINATGIYVNGAAVGAGGGSGTLSPATTSTLGGVIVPGSGGLLVDASGNLSVNWAAPSAGIGSTTPKPGAFTALTSTSLLVGSPTGGSQGTGSINAQAIYVQGVSLSATSNYNAASVAITGGTINRVSIGGSTPAAGSFTALSASGGGTLNNTIIGGATAAAGTFTTLQVTGTANASVLFGTSQTMDGALIWNPAGMNAGYHVPYFDIYSSDAALVYGLAVSLPPPTGVAALGGLQHGLGICGSSSNTGSGIFGVMTPAQIGGFGLHGLALGVTDKNRVYSYNNTLDDGAGNSVITGSLTVGGSFTLSAAIAGDDEVGAGVGRGSGVEGVKRGALPEMPTPAPRRHSTAMAAPVPVPL
jgi:hypothetical protein